MLLIYVAIMATRLARTERELTELRARRRAPAARRQPAIRTASWRAGGVSELLAIGVSHKTAPVEVRERVALPDARGAEFVRDLRGTGEVQEAVAISTCNRTELYVVVGNPVEAESRALAMLASQAGIRPTELAPAIYSLRNCDAARHLYRVTAGLDSMIVGEAEVQGQVKRAYEAAIAGETAGPLTNHLFKAALATGKRVRTETAIGERQLSLPAVAVALAREQLGDLVGRTVVIVGTGETGELAARALSDSGGRPVFVASRRRDRAISLARRYGGESMSFDELPQALERADILVAATASPHLLLEAAELSEVMAAAPAAAAAADRSRGPARHRRRLRRARRRVAVRHRRPPGRDRPQPQGPPGRGAQGRGDHRGGDPAVRRVARVARGAADAGGAPGSRHRDRRAGRGRERGASGSASPRDLERVDALARAIVNRLLHAPTARLKELQDDRVHARMALIRDLFGLEVESGAPASSGRGTRPRRAAPSSASSAVDPGRDAWERARARAGGMGGFAPRRGL